MGKRAGRVESLLEQLGLSDRLIKNINKLPEDRIEYEMLQLRLQHLVKESCEYLAKGICGSEE